MFIFLHTNFFTRAHRFPIKNNPSTTHEFTPYNSWVSEPFVNLIVRSAKNYLKTSNPSQNNLNVQISNYFTQVERGLSFDYFCVAITISIMV